MKLRKTKTKKEIIKDEEPKKLKRIKFVIDDYEKIKIIASLYLAFYEKPQIKKLCYTTGFMYPFFIDDRKKRQQQKLTIFQLNKGVTIHKEYERLYSAAKQYIITNLTKKDKTLMRAEMYNILTNKLNEAFITNNNQLCLDCIKQIRQLNGLDLEEPQEELNKQNIVNNITIDLDKVHDYLEYCYTKSKDDKENNNNDILNNQENDIINKDTIKINLIQKDDE